MSKTLYVPKNVTQEIIDGVDISKSICSVPTQAIILCSDLDCDNCVFYIDNIKSEQPVTLQTFEEETENEDDY